MTPVSELIAHFKRRLDECANEIKRIEVLPEGRHTTHADHDRWIKGWEAERRIARDTISYLQTIEGRGIAP